MAILSANNICAGRKASASRFGVTKAFGVPGSDALSYWLLRRTGSDSTRDDPMRLLKPLCPASAPSLASSLVMGGAGSVDDGVRPGHPAPASPPPRRSRRPGHRVLWCRPMPASTGMPRRWRWSSGPLTPKANWQSWLSVSEGGKQVQGSGSWPTMVAPSISRTSSPTRATR